MLCEMYVNIPNILTIIQFVNNLPDDPNNQIKLEFVTFKNDHNIIMHGLLIMNFITRLAKENYQFS